MAKMPGAAGNMMAEVECRGFRVSALTWPAAFPEICCDQGLIVVLRADGLSEEKTLPVSSRQPSIIYKDWVIQSSCAF